MKKNRYHKSGIGVTLTKVPEQFERCVHKPNHLTERAHLNRKAAPVPVCGLREPDPRPVHPARLPGPGVARGLSEVRGV